MKMEKLKTISVAMILGGAFGGVAGTLEGATILGMVIGAAAGAGEVICLESGTSCIVMCVGGEYNKRDILEGTTGPS